MSNIKKVGFAALLAILILLGVGCTSEVVIEECEEEYPRPGAASSYYFEGPHLLYENENIRILRGVGINGEMRIETSTYDQLQLSSFSVYKPGFLPRTFEVKLKPEIKPPPTYYPEAATIFAVSDIEGNFNALINLMQQHGVINDQLDWIFGTGHFVMVGDVFDRGNHVTEMLWFLYRLEEQAIADGGYVHMLLGNHEALNLRGDLRYIELKYATFAQLTKDQHGIVYTDLFSMDSELGRWLRSKNVVEKIGDKLFVHAGISPEMRRRDYTLEEINSFSREMLDKPKSGFNSVDSLMWSKAGPFWYRGYFDINEEKWGPRASQSNVENVLDHYQASQVIVGHTHVEQPELRYEGRVCAIDVQPPADHMVYVPPIHAYGALFRDSSVFRADDNGRLTELTLQK